MKLRNKLIMPLLGIISTAGVVAPITTSCGNGAQQEDPDAVAGKIIMDKRSVIDGIEMKASKETFTNKEAEEGFDVTFTIDESTQEYLTPVFVLEKIMAGGEELNNDKFSVEYDEEAGYFATSFVVTLKPGVPKSDLTFTLRFNDDEFEIPVVEKCATVVMGTVTLNPAVIYWPTWDQKFTLTWSEGSSIINYIEILYSDTTETTVDMQIHEMAKETEYTTKQFAAETSEAIITDLGVGRLVLMFASYVYVKVRIGWAEAA